MTERLRSLPLPQDPSLAAWASALNAGGRWANVYDSSWRLVFATDELRLSLGDTGPVTFMPIGFHFFGADERPSREVAVRTYGGHLMDREERRAGFLRVGPYVLGSMPGGREALRRLVDPEFADLVDALQPQALPVAWFRGAVRDRVAGVDVVGSVTYFRIDDSNGDTVGVGSMLKPAAGMSQLAAAAYTLDLAHLERTRAVERADRRPAAILMADLEASSPLARRLSTATYFAFGRRLVRAAHRCIVDAGGIVGRHVGDGIAADSELAETELSLRFGLHWGGTLYIGRILTAARSEVTALGDEVNEAARIEACANGGRTLASKSLVERLNQADALALGIDTNHLTYTPLAELPPATDKARRDAPLDRRVRSLTTTPYLPIGHSS